MKNRTKEILGATALLSLGALAVTSGREDVKETQELTPYGSFTIENGDTLENPLILENGQIRKFDRVLANPPFSQNYSRANVKFNTRFREWCPESGKKADLMFVQHMLASLKPKGYMATVTGQSEAGSAQ